MKNAKNYWREWQKLAYKAMEFQAKIILIFLYFTLLIPVGVLFRLTHDVLGEKRVKSTWRDWVYTNNLKEM